MTADDGTAVAASAADRLLALQRVDTESDQLTVRRERLPERAELGAKSERLADWERRRAAMRERIEHLGAAMEAAERRSGELGVDKRRFEAQLKTIIAPREAEALLHEIATVDGQLDELDERELADLSELTVTEEALADHLLEEGSLRDAVGQADEALALAVADIDRELAALDERRRELRATLDPAHLAHYDRVRGQLGVGVARLVGRRCDGCHLDLSAAEVDTAKEEAAETGVTDCPQCGRMLVV